MTIASLPMYDLETLRDATDAWWRGLAAAFRKRGLEDVPDTLERGCRYEHWSSPDLLLSQCCGYPLTHDFADRVRLVAVPFHDAPWCRGADYCSLVVVGEASGAGSLEELRGARAAVNGFDSQSGFNALRAAVAPHARGGRFFGEVVESGSHRDSLAMVAAGRADVCAVDCVSHALWSDTMGEILAGTRILSATPHAPSLPYVTRIGCPDAELLALRQGLLDAAADPALADVRARLRLVGFTLLPAGAYRRIDALEQHAADLGYPDLA